MEIFKKGEKVPNGKYGVLLAGLGAPRMIVVSTDIVELQHYAVTYSAFWEQGSRAWRGGELWGFTGANEMDFNGEIWNNEKGKRTHVMSADTNYRSKLYKRCLEEIMDNIF